MHLTRPVLALLAGAALAAGIAAPAAAHVSVNPNEATQGGYAKLTFRVPSEKPAATTSVQVSVPAEANLTSFRVQPHPGWTYEVARDGDKVSSVTWTTEGEGILAGEFEEFNVSVGPLPESESVTFPALQTYATGEVVRWVEPANADGSEPEPPAPVLTLTAATEGEDAHRMTATSTAPESTDAPTTTAASDDGDSGLPVGLQIVSLTVGILGLVFGIVALALAQSAKKRA